MKGNALIVYFIFAIEVSDSSQENLCYIIWYVKRNNCVLNTVFILCLLMSRGLIMSLSRRITVCYSPFLWMFIHLGTCTLPQCTKGLFHWWAFKLLPVFIHLHVCLLLIRVLCPTCWEWPTNITLVNSLSITRVCYL